MVETSGNTQLVRVSGTDVIFLAGRTDLTIPLLSNFEYPSFPLARIIPARADYLPETFPKFVTVDPGNIVTFQASGSVDFFGDKNEQYNPDGNNSIVSNLSEVGSITGYLGPAGALVGVFLNDNIPSSPKLLIGRLDFTSADLGTSFTLLQPELGDVFFIGDGRTEAGQVQQFIVPRGATRLFVGIADGFGFRGQPGAYEDNDGSYFVSISSILGEGIKTDVTSSPYWRDIDELTNISQDKISNINSSARKRISDILTAKGNHILDELLSDSPEKLQELRSNLAKDNYVLDVHRQSLKQNIEEVYQKLPFIPGPKFRELVDSAKSRSVNILIAQGKFSNAVASIAAATGRSAIDPLVIGAAAALTLGSELSNGSRSVSGTPQRSTLRSLVHQYSQDETTNQGNLRRTQGSVKNDRLLGTTQDDRLFGKGGNDVLSGQQGWDILIGDIGKDRLVGGDGSDMLNGCGKKFVAGEVDRLTGGEDIDFFILGDPNRVYYDDKNRRTAGNRDFAVIADFNFNQDFLILKGKFSDYIFKRDKIFLNNDGVRGLSRNDELIAQIKGAANLNPIHIMFV